MKEKSFEPGRDNIVLIGMPGAGKSTLGIVLAKILNYQFVDADLVIQNQCDKTLQKLIDACGPEGFIQVENEILRDIEAENSIIATGGSAVAAIQYLRRIGVKNIKLMVLVAAPAGIEAVLAADPDVQIYTCAVDEGLNDHAYIVPGLGDAGDRIFGTK